MLDDLEREELLPVFLSDCEESLALLEQMLLVLENRTDDDAINAIFRAAHTLKGNSASLGYETLASLSHAMEDLLHEVRAKRFVVTGDLVTLLLHAADVFRQMIPAAVGGANALPEVAIAVIASLEAAKAAGHVTSSAPIFAEVETADPKKSVEPGHKLRIDLERLDVILNLTGELSIASGRLLDGLSVLPDPHRERMLSTFVDLERVLADLQEQVARVRMVPIGPRFEQHRRTVRDLSRAAGKRVQLAIEGHDVEIDASLVEQIKDPLTHMIRNAVDHGIEPAAVRRARGKSETATITLRAYHDGGSVVLQIADDGGGFDRDRILTKARERGMVPSGLTPSDDEIFGYVVAPGFSTSERVTEISGRGVGMDVVSRAVAAMRGSLGVSSVPGTSSTISLRLPLTLAMLEGLVIVAAGERFVVPMDVITECVALPAAEPRERTFGIAEVRGRTVPYIRLRRFLGLESLTPVALEQMVVVEADHNPVGIVADDLLGQMAVVIKPLGKILRSVAGVSASTIFPDGRVGVILDVAAIARRSQREPTALLNV